MDSLHDHDITNVTITAGTYARDTIVYLAGVCDDCGETVEPSQVPLQSVDPDWVHVTEGAGTAEPFDLANDR